MPGVFVSRQIIQVPDKPMLGVVQFIPDPATGQEFRVITAWERPVRISRINYDSWGLGGSYDAFYKLVRAGFVKARRLTPEVLEVLPSSLVKHVRACEDPEFWTSGRMERYRMATYENIRHPLTSAQIARRAKKKRHKKKRKDREGEEQLDLFGHQQSKLF